MRLEAMAVKSFYKKYDLVPAVRFERTLDGASGHCLCQLGYAGVSTGREIRTLTGHGLNVLPLPNWATPAFQVVGFEPTFEASKASLLPELT